MSERAFVRLCRVDDVPESGSREFSVGEGDWPLRGLLVRRCVEIVAYENRCPHAGHALNLREHDFLTPDRTLIRCCSHGALFEIATGECVAGPCTGQRLKPLPICVVNDEVLLELQ